MANEIAIVYPVSGLATVTIAIYKPDLTIRDGQTAEALSDSGHLNLYGNTDAITVVAGDIIKPAVAGVNFGNGGIYKEAENDVWDALLTASNHNVPTSAGRRLRTMAAHVIRNELARGPGTGNNQIQFDVDASAVNGSYDPGRVCIIAGTGVGQSRLIYQYRGSDKVATVDRNWKVNPADDSEFIIISDPGREHVNEGLAQSATANTIKLNELASDEDDVYRNQMVFIRSGKGEDQVKRIIGYDGTTKIATLPVSDDWAVIPDSTSAYVMLPLVCVETQAIKGTELTAKTGENFETFFNNGGRTSELIMDLLNANKIINTDTTPWQLEYKHKTTGDILLIQKMTNTEAENIRSINNVLGGLTAP